MVAHPSHDQPGRDPKTPYDHALALIAAGYWVFPVIIRRDPVSGKKLGDYLRIRWHDESTRDPEVVRDWTVQYPDCSFGVDTGRSGVFAVDLDVPATGPSGESVWSGAHLPLGRMIVRTPGGGYHHYFRAVAGETLTVHKRIHGHPIDVRGDGGHVYAPGAQVLGPGDVPELRRYDAVTGIVAVADLEPVPDLVLEFLHAQRGPGRTRRSPEAQGEVRTRSWVVDACREQLDRVQVHPARTDSGFRGVLMGAALVLGRASAAGLFARPALEKRLRAAVETVWGRVDQDDLHWIRDGLDDGEADPWTVVADDYDTEIPAGDGSGSSFKIDSVSAATACSSPSSEPLGPSNNGGDPSDPFDVGWTTPDPSAAVHADGADGADGAGQSADGGADGSADGRTDDGAGELDVSADEVRARRRARLFAEELERAEIREDVRTELLRRKRAGRPALADSVIDDLDDIPEPVMLMGSLIPDEAVGFLAGRSGAYKSFLATAWACCIATGTAWLGRPEFRVLEPRKGLYVAAEGRAGAAGRIRAWEAATSVSRAGKLLLYGRPVHLTDPVQVAELADYVAAQAIRFLVIDTYQRSAPGLDESSNGDFSGVFEAAARLRDDHGCTVLFVDHTGHQGGGRPRGQSAKGDDADFVLAAMYDGLTRGPGVQRVLEVLKLKDDESTGSWNIRLAEVAEQRFPVVVIDQTDGGALVPSAEWWLGAPEVPEVIHAAMSSASVEGRGVEHARWIWRALMALTVPGQGFTRSELTGFLKGSPAETRGLSPSVVQRGIKLLEVAGIGERDGQKLALTPMGRKSD
jgi:AAA domain/Bifunctional DNA primase/polymerase, N-terminal